MFSKYIEHEFLSIINFLFSILERVSPINSILINSILLKFFLKDEEIFLTSQKTFTFLYLSIKI